ncbi:hypothetical protein SCZ71_12780 [Legionella pneumophila serogroup 1]|uniref:hypothetical protein n=1 Tax=Legionella pneumophila TaxID=446 RepID=UPI0007709B2A|nr:hypothetical protein [Legionella pneumophila]HAT8862526.1 hypothetical protein [Legionella pneumophila subsp. pneumophila]MDI9825867.1 hypothetical protein [Legionella pneumophila]MDW8896995.1 hypothetical protein [Legionella pneumophila]CZH49333.1 Uncharacterised protein [Legionella pneumophila]CZI54797.1 Uncharacterised protein [Legionella pneumophila]
MFSGKLFKNEQNEKYFNLGGPRSFHKFTLQGTNIILIGEVHERMPNELATQYIEMFSNFIESNDEVKLFLETTGEDKKSSSKGLSFLDCMQHLSYSKKVATFHADKRYYYDQFGNFFFFLNKLAELEGTIIAKYKEKRIKPPSPTPFFDTPEFLDSVNQLSQLYKKNFCLLDLYKLLESQLKILEELVQKYAEENKQISDYLTVCLLEVNDALGLTLKLEEEYRSMSRSGDETQNRSLIDICIEMMAYQGSFSPAVEWLQIYDLYETNFLDATLICDLWEAIKIGGENKPTFILVFGDKHIEKLSNFLKIIATEEISIKANKNGKIIPPKFMEEYLKDHFEHAPSENNCVLM